MTKEELLAALERTLVKTKAVKLATLAGEHSFRVKDLIDLTFFREAPVAFRAAWVLEHTATHFPGIFAPDVPYFLEKYPLQDNESCRRHYTKLMAYILTHRSLQPAFIDYPAVIEATFSWLAGPQTPVAVKANCMDILYLLRGQEDWIAEELAAQISFLLHNGTAALQSRGKKILAKLSHNKFYD